jgi:phosphatidylserine/phosphatidylglycerophosphate/cardiolipin synthase-like enzyme
VTDALLSAADRGVRVRVVTDVDTLGDPNENASFLRLKDSSIPVVGGNPNGIMHDKFVVVDAAAVWTGSWNFTENDTYRYNNNGILISSPALAHNYTATFDKMFSQHEFGPKRKRGGTTQQVLVDGIRVENLFAPEDDVTSEIARRIRQAKTAVDFMAFSFTDDTIGGAVLARANAGIPVRGVFETTGSETVYCEYDKMKAAGLDVWLDGNPYLMHHKVFILDAATVIFGSFNFSVSAQQDNDENLLIVDDASLAQQFESEFGKVYAAAKQPH